MLESQRISFLASYNPIQKDHFERSTPSALMYNLWTSCQMALLRVYVRKLGWLSQEGEGEKFLLVWSFSHIRIDVISLYLSFWMSTSLYMIPFLPKASEPRETQELAIFMVWGSREQAEKYQLQAWAVGVRARGQLLQTQAVLPQRAPCFLKPTPGGHLCLSLEPASLFGHLTF